MPAETPVVEKRLATLCYVRQGGKTLMVHVKKAGGIHEGKWNAPGGKLDAGESPEECVVREIREETGLIISDAELKGVLTFPAFQGASAKPGKDWYVFVFVARKVAGILTSSSPEGELKWVPDAELVGLNLNAGDKLFLPLLDRPGSFSAKITYDGDKVVSHDIRTYGA